MKIQHLAKISTAIACTLTLCANAADSQDASLISKNYSADNIN